MSNKSRLQTNNTNLQALIDKANALPDAGGGSCESTEMCIVTCSLVNDNTNEPFDIYYTDGSGSGKMTTETEYYNGTLTCVKGSLIYFPVLATAPGVANISVTGGVSILTKTMDPLFAVNGDGSISY